MTRPLIILGHSTQLLDLIDVCERLNIPVAGIIDNDYFGNTESFEGVPFIGSELTADFEKLKFEYDFFIGVNPVPDYPRNIVKRHRFIDIVDQFDLPCPNLIDPQCRINHRVKMGKGIFVNFMGVIGPYVTIGDHCQINVMSGIGHHCELGKNVIVQRKATILSSIKVGENSFICNEAKLLKPELQIGKNSYIHPGVIVMRNVEDNEVISLTGRNTRRIYDTKIFD